MESFSLLHDDDDDLAPVQRGAERGRRRPLLVNLASHKSLSLALSEGSASRFRPSDLIREDPPTLVSLFSRRICTRRRRRWSRRRGGPRRGNFDEHQTLSHPRARGGDGVAGALHCGCVRRVEIPWPHSPSALAVLATGGHVRTDGRTGEGTSCAGTFWQAPTTTTTTTRRRRKTRSPSENRVRPRELGCRNGSLGANVGPSQLPPAGGRTLAHQPTTFFDARERKRKGGKESEPASAEAIFVQRSHNPRPRSSPSPSPSPSSPFSPVAPSELF